MEKTATVGVTKNQEGCRRLPKLEVKGHSGVVFEVYRLALHQETLPGNYDLWRVVEPWIFFFKVYLHFVCMSVCLHAHMSGYHMHA